MNITNPNNSEIDLLYLDEKFITLMNSLDSETFSSLFSYLIKNYSANLSIGKLSDFSKIINSEIKADIDFSNIYRQFKYIINKGTILRLSKKFLTELFNLGLEEDKVNLIKETQKIHLDKLIEILNINQKDSDNNHVKEINKIIDVDIKTEMPIYTSNYQCFAGDNLNSMNNDIKKQNIYLSLKIDKKTTEKKEVFNEDLEKNIFYQNLNIKMDKTQFTKFFAEIEKIQESLDKLC